MISVADEEEVQNTQEEHKSCRDPKGRNVRSAKV